MTDRSSTSGRLAARWRGRYPPTIRARLTLLYAGVLALVMVVYATTIFLAVSREFQQQFDHRLHEDFEAAEDRLIETPDGGLGWPAPLHQADHADEGRAYELWSIAGERLRQTGVDVRLPPIAAGDTDPTYRYATVEGNGQRWRTLAAAVTVAGRRAILRVSQSEERLRHELQEILFVLVVALPVVVALAGAGGYVLAGRALAPIDHLASAAERVTAARLHDRLTAVNPHDEIGRLTAVINDMLERLELSFGQLRQFTADASHELRTPLAVLRGTGEAALAVPRSGEEYGEAIGSMLEEIDRMTRLVETLLRLSQADAGALRLAREPVDLGELARHVATSLAVLAEERGQTIDCGGTAGVMAPVDRLVLGEALSNVLDNAISYGPVGSTVSVRVERLDGEAVLSIADEGPGIPPEHRERVFDRFYRVDEARTRERGGAGLGLAIAKWAVELHGGRITVEGGPTGGATFRIVLPAESGALDTR